MEKIMIRFGDVIQKNLFEIWYSYVIKNIVSNLILKYV